VIQARNILWKCNGRKHVGVDLSRNKTLYADRNRIWYVIIEYKPRVRNCLYEINIFNRLINILLYSLAYKYIFKLFYQMEI